MKIKCNTIYVEREEFIMAISVRLNNQDEKMFKHYAKMNNISMSELIRSSVIERIEDEYDLNVYKKAMKEYEANPITHTLDEIEKELGLI